MMCTATAPLCDRLQPNCDVTLREVLQHPAGVKFFKDFLIIRSVLRFHLTPLARYADSFLTIIECAPTLPVRGSLCAENLLFWLEVEDFKNIPGLDFMKIHAKKITVKYITEDAKQQVRPCHTLAASSRWEDRLHRANQPGHATQTHRHLDG